MPAKTKQTNNKKAKYQGFVNVSLTGKHKEQINRAWDGGIDCAEFLDNLTSEGYKVSISYTANGGFYTVTGMQMDTVSGHAGYCTSSRHSDVTKAIYTLHYSISEILNVEGWPMNDGGTDW